MAASRIASLDGLRAIAIGLVLAEHGGVAFTDASSHWWAAPLINGGFGVRLFFVLSGFLITGLLIREQERYGRISLRAFYVRRILRIFPAFYLYLGTVAALAAAGWIAVSGSQILAAGTYTWNYLERWQPGGPAEGIWFLGHLWTLSLEEQFYLVWPGVIVLAGWRSARRAALLVPLAVPVLRVLLYVAFPAQRGQLGMMFHTGIDSIFIGCAFALWHEQLVVRLEKRSYMLGAALFAFIVSPHTWTFFPRSLYDYSGLRIGRNLRRDSHRERLQRREIL